MGEFKGIESIRGLCSTAGAVSPLRMLLTTDLRTKTMAGGASSVQLLRSCGSCFVPRRRCLLLQSFWSLQANLQILWHCPFVEWVEEPAGGELGLWENPHA